MVDAMAKNISDPRNCMRYIFRRIDSSCAEVQLEQIACLQGGGFYIRCNNKEGTHVSDQVNIYPCLESTSTFDLDTLAFCERSPLEDIPYGDKLMQYSCLPKYTSAMHVVCAWQNMESSWWR